VSLADTWGRKVQVIGEDNNEPQEAVTLSRMISSDRFLGGRMMGGRARDES
jgi:hypothetical protein